MVAQTLQRRFSDCALVSCFLFWQVMHQTLAESRLLLIAAFSGIAVALTIEVILAIPLIFILSIRQTHRVVGPINRMKRTLQAIGEGDFSKRIRLRDGDALLEIAFAVNKMAERLQQRFPRARP